MADTPKFPYHGVEHFGFTVDDVDAAVAELRAKGAEIAVGPLTRDAGTRLAFVRGPEGIMPEGIMPEGIMVELVRPGSGLDPANACGTRAEIARVSCREFRRWPDQARF